MIMRRKERAGIRAMKNKTPGGSIIRNTVYAHLAAFILSSLSATIGSLVADRDERIKSGIT